MSTATKPARNGRLFADEPPEHIREALEAVVLADKGFFQDRMAFRKLGYSPERSERLTESRYQLGVATETAERLLEDYLGERLHGCWPIAGRCVGFSPVSRYGMTLRVEPASSKLKGARP